MNAPDVFVGSAGVARRVADDRLAASLQGHEVATIVYWWIHTPGVGILVAHTGELDREVTAVADLEVMVPPAGEQSMDTYALALITLADLPGVPPAKKAGPWVTHELTVFTIDTQQGPVTVDARLPWPLMQPHNVSVQFEVHDDDQARDVAAYVAAAVVNGMLPGEVQAFVPERHKMMTLAGLHELWQATVSATAEHARTGGTHVEADGPGGGS